jgi:hypothetical protein
VVAAIAILSGATAQAQPGEPGRLVAWARAGLFRPSSGDLRQVYDGSRVSIAAQVDWRVRPTIALFGGIRNVRMDGRAVVEGGTAFQAPGGGAYPTRLVLTSVRAGALLVFRSGAWDFRPGAGFSVERYAEEWPAAALDAKGGRAGWLLQATLSREVGRRVSAGVTVEYAGASVPQREGERAVGKVGLGGLHALAGVGVRF